MTTDLHLLYISGEPGIGKSTLMRQLTDGWGRYPQPGGPFAPGRDLLTDHGRVVAVELGRRRDSFSGTDALHSAVIEDATRYLRSGSAATEAPLLLAEGARLANLRFLRCARDAGWRITLAHLYGTRLAAARRAARAEQLGRAPQSEQWVRGRATAARNLANACTAEPGMTVLAVDCEAGDPLPVVRDWLTHPPAEADR
jgi:hypothetical protein